MSRKKVSLFRLFPELPPELRLRIVEVYVQYERHRESVIKLCYCRRVCKEWVTFLLPMLQNSKPVIMETPNVATNVEARKWVAELGSYKISTFDCYMGFTFATFEQVYHFFVPKKTPRK